MKKLYKKLPYRHTNYIRYVYIHPSDLFSVRNNLDKVITEIDAIIEKSLNLPQDFLTSCTALNIMQREESITTTLIDPLKLKIIYQKLLIQEL